MAGLTLAQAQAHLDVWLAADLAVAGGQSYSIRSGDSERQMTRADAVEIRTNINYWQGKVDALSSAGRRRTRYVVPE